jgi:rSAM/selenodomain-associated transferase 1
VVFTKPARPGRVKTRLIGELTAEQTAELHQAFLDDLVARFDGGPHAVWLAWALEEGESAPESRLPSLRQTGEDLGARLWHALCLALEQHPFVAAVGSDHPDLPVERVDEAFSRLAEGADVVFGPADDGGYYLVGARRGALRRRVFEEIPWSTPRVLEAALERCREAGLEAELLALGYDIDTPADLPRLGSHLRRHPGDCPRTRTLLDRWGLIAG